ncbi:MAG: FIVAR domain-containing protein [Lachnospiraceae bacterium]|nr:FIVAR domain-containing protein [Lachnospiraceae bacterium]
MRLHKEISRILIPILIFSLIMGTPVQAAGMAPASGNLVPPSNTGTSGNTEIPDTPDNTETSNPPSTEEPPKENEDGDDNPDTNVVDKTVLKEQIEIASALNKEDYTAESYEELEKALTAAKTVYESDLADEASVIEATDNLKKAISSLQLIITIDKSLLKGLIDQAELLIQDKNSYVTTSYESLTASLTLAKAVYGNENSDQTAVDNAANSLKTIIESMKFRAKDKTGLKQSINAALNIKGWLYTKSTYKKVTTALTSAQTIYNNIDAVQEEVNDQKAKLDKAVAGLKKDVQPYKISGNTYYYDIRAFGAVPNDKTSDKTAIQAALDKAGEDHKIVVTVYGGLYYIGSTLCIQSNTTIQMDSASTIRRSKTSVNMLKVTDAAHKTTPYYGYTLGHDITITGGTWDGGDISKTTVEKNLIYIGHSQNVTVSNTTIKNCYGTHALEFAGVINSTIKKCTFTGFRYAPDRFTAEAVQLDICDKDSSGAEWTPGYTMDGTTCKNITLSNNTFIDYPRGIGCHHVYSDGRNKNGANSGPYENITISKNKFKRSSASTQSLCSSGIFIMGAKKITISSNTVDRYAYGIWVKRSSGITLKNNKLKYNSNANIIYSGNTGVKDAIIKFTVTQDKYKTKTLKYTCPTIKKGYVKTAGKTYRFKKAASTHTAKLKKTIKRNQKMTFYGQDAKGNKFYRIYYTPKKSK